MTPDEISSNHFLERVAEDGDSSEDETENLLSDQTHLLDIRLDPQIHQLLFGLHRLNVSLENYEAHSLAV